MKDKELAQAVLEAVYQDLNNDITWYEERFAVIDNEKDVIRNVNRQAAVKHFLKCRVPAIAEEFGLERPGQPKPEPRLKLIVNNR